MAILQMAFEKKGGSSATLIRSRAYSQAICGWVKPSSSNDLNCQISARPRLYLSNREHQLTAT
jgi:hypothetical protein